MSGAIEVGAVLLSQGEPFVDRARASLERQSLPIAPIVTIEHVSPFFRALNAGAAQMPTPWFVQVDADMILDPDCVETLLGRARPDTGMVVAELRDPLSARVIGVKLFRTACFREVQVQDSIGQDTDFVKALDRRGWRTVYVENVAPDGSISRSACGEHRPEYTPAYTYRKLLVEGRKLRHRSARHGLYYRTAQLEASTHPLALLAQIALGHGFFLRSERDELRPAGPDATVARTVALLASDERLEVSREGRAGGRDLPLRAVFQDHLAAGEAIGARGAGGTLRSLMNGLSPVGRQPRRMVAKVALSHGLLMDDDDRRNLTADTSAFRDFMLYSLGSGATWRDHFTMRAAHLARVGRRPASYVPW